MKKKQLLLLLLVFMSATVMAKTYKTIKTLEAMACVNLYDGQLKAEEVVMTDTATSVRFVLEFRDGDNLRIQSSSYLMDEDGNRYSLRSAEGITLDKYMKSKGTIHYTLHFQPMPKNVKVFDYIESDESNAFMLLSIHDKKTKIKVPTLKEISGANPFDIPADWLKTDTITIKGKIEEYDAKKFGFTSMQCYHRDIFDRNSTTLILDISPDGTFEKKFLARYPVFQIFRPINRKNSFSEMPFFARPGETIDITVKKNSRGQYKCHYNGGSSKNIEQMNHAWYEIRGMLLPLDNYRGPFSKINTQADKAWKNLMYRLGIYNKLNCFTPMEMQLMIAEAQSEFVLAFMDNVLNREIKLGRTEKGTKTAADSAELRDLMNADYYQPLHRIDFDNPLMLSAREIYFVINRLQYSEIVIWNKYELARDEKGEIRTNAGSRKKIVDNVSMILRKIMGDSHNNLLVQMCAYKDMQHQFNSWRKIEEGILSDTTLTEAECAKRLTESETMSKMMPIYFAMFDNNYVYERAELFYASKLAQKNLTMPLLADDPYADLIRSLVAKYPNRYIVIDFWGMGCGPCRSAIESNKELRADIAKRKDVKLVFIAEERTKEGSKEYKEYIAKWLADEETICLPYAEFARMRELFNFNGIPHYETITPDCKRVCDDFRISGFYHFKEELERLKNKLK